MGDKSNVRYMKDNRDCYCMPAGLEKSLSTTDCSKYFKIVNEKSWADFDEYKNHIKTINYVERNSKDWIKSRCSCVYWAKNCHHVVGPAVTKKKCAYLVIHMEIPIGQSRPRGKPKKTASALTKQSEIILSDTSSSDSETSDISPTKQKVVKKT